MTTRLFVACRLALRPARSLRAFAGLAFAALLAACGGHADAPPPDAPPVVGGGVAPTITTQPTDLAVTAGQPATFSVVASGDATLTYQWQRAGSPIAGAKAATYTLTTTTVGDSGAVFKVVVSNDAGSATSRDATLTVSASAPVLTITQQPASTSAVAGTTASFTVAATCSSGTLGVQWQRSTAGGAFADIAGATSASYSVSTGSGDNGALFRAYLACSGQSAISSQAATLTVTSPTSVTVTPYPINGRESQANSDAFGIFQQPDGSFAITVGLGVRRMPADFSRLLPLAGGMNPGNLDGPAASALFSNPSGITGGAAGNLYLVTLHAIRRVGSDGNVTTVAGVYDTAGATDGSGAAARFSQPTGIALGPDGDLYVADTANHRIRRVSTAGVVTTYAGSTQGYAEGTAAAAQFNAPLGIAVAANGDVLVADSGNNRVRRILRAGNSAGVVETLAGDGTATAGSADGTGTAAVIRRPFALYLRGNTLAVLDTAGLLRSVDLTSAVVTTITGSRALGGGYADGSKTTARLGAAGSLTGTANGGFVIADAESQSVRSVDAAGNVRTIATSGAFDHTAAGTGVLAQMPLAIYSPSGTSVPPAQTLTVDATGNVVIAESAASDLRRITPSGDVSLVAGLTGASARSVDGVGSEAQFRGVGRAIASAANGVIYVGDLFALRRIGSDGAVTTVAGSTTLSGAVDGQGTAARFGPIQALAIGPNGDVFAADPNNHVIRRIDAAGNVTTYAGVLGQTGTADGPIATARLTTPSGLAFTADGSLLVADNYRLRKISADGSTVTTLYDPATFGYGVLNIAVAADGAVYYSGSPGEVSGSIHKLVPGDNSPTAVVGFDGTGGTPSGFVYALAFSGPKQLAVLVGGRLVKVTLP